MTNISNSTSKDNPPWLLAEPAGAVRLPGPRAPADSAPQTADAATRASSGPRTLLISGRIMRVAGRVLPGWLAAIPRRLGDRLFAANDIEADWRGWQITRTHAGLARRYRDPRFGSPDRGTRGENRGTRGEVS